MARLVVHSILGHAPLSDHSLGRLDMANFGAALHSSGNLAIPSLRKVPKIDRSLGRLDMANFGAALHSSGNLAIPSYGMLRKRPLFPLLGSAFNQGI